MSVVRGPGAVTVADVIARIDREPDFDAEVDGICEQLALSMKSAHDMLDSQSATRIRACIMRLRTLQARAKKIA